MKKIFNILFILGVIFAISISNTYAYNNYVDSTISCGRGLEFARALPNACYYIILVVEVAAPITLIIFGMLDLSKSIMSGKEEEIKKGQATFIKRLIAGILVFFVIFFTKLVVNVFADKNVSNCLDCFLNGPRHCGQ